MGLRHVIAVIASGAPIAAVTAFTACGQSAMPSSDAGDSGVLVDHRVDRCTSCDDVDSPVDDDGGDAGEIEQWKEAW